MANQLDQYSSAYQPEILGMNRQRKLAEMLIAQGQQQPQGQMVGGRFIPVAPTQNIANLFNTALGAYGMYSADQKAIDLANRIREGEIEAFADFEKTRRGTPAVVENTEMAGPYTGNVPKPMLSRDVVPAVPPNPQAAYANLYYNPKASPKMRDLAFAKMTTEPEAFTLPEGSIRFQTMPDGTVRQIAAGGEKIRAPIQVDIGTHIEFRDPLDPNRVIARVAKAKDGSGKDFGNALALRKEFNGEGIYKGYQEVKNAWSQINTGLNSKSPAGDLAAATKFMKLLDPTSVVRESELLMAMQASGALDRLYNYAQMRVAGTKLTPTQREDFRRLSDEFYQTSLNQYNEKFNEYRDIALRNNLNPDDIGKPDVFKPQAAPKKEEKPKTTVGQQLNVPAVKTPKFLGFETTPTGQK